MSRASDEGLVAGSGSNPTTGGLEAQGPSDLRRWCKIAAKSGYIPGMGSNLGAALLPSCYNSTVSNSGYIYDCFTLAKLPIVVPIQGDST